MVPRPDLVLPPADYEHGIMDDIGLNSLDDATPSEIAEHWDQCQHDRQHEASDQDEDQTTQAPAEQASTDGIHGCYRSENLFATRKHLMAFEYWEDGPGDLFELGDLPEPIANAHEKLEDMIANEQLDVDKEGMAFLAKVMSYDVGDDFINVQDERSALRKLKVELPILEHDPELELLMLRERHKRSINFDGVEPWIHDEKYGRDLDKEMNDPNILAEMEARIANETLEVSKDTAEYIRSIAEQSRSSYADMIDMLIWPKRPDRFKVETPLLLPQSPSQRSPPMDASLLEFELTSTPQDLIAAEAAEVERTLLARDDEDSIPGDAFEHAGQSSDLAPQLPSDSISSDIHISALIAKPFPKVEVPLTPQDWTTSSTDETSKQPNATIGPDSLIPLPESDQSQPDREAAEQELRRCLKEIAGPAVAAMEQKLNNEKLTILDAVMRVPVPKMDHSLPPPPWQCSAANPNSIKRVKEDFWEDGILWSDTDISELERVLPWTAFPLRLGQITDEEVNNEELEVDKSVAKYLSSIAFEGEPDIDSIIPQAYKLSRARKQKDDDEKLLALLADLQPDEGADEDQDEPAAVLDTGPPPITTYQQFDSEAVTMKPDTTYGTDMQSLLRKRKLELAIPSTILPDPSSKPKHHAERAASTVVRAQVQHARVPTLSDSLGAGSIGQFLQLQGKVKPSALSEVVTKHPIQHASAPTAVMALPQQEHYPPETAIPIVPAPQLLQSPGPVQVILGSSMLADRTLIRDLQTQLPTLDIIERSSVTTAEEGNKKAREMLNTDCDITLSPDTGLIMTTLQKLKQKPLPGQEANHAGIREGIAAVSTRYGRVIVLVAGGEGVAAGTAALDERDCDAIAELTTFGEALGTAIEVHVVPGGSKEVVKWLAPLIVQHAGTSTATKLLQEETQWEHFLRLAGLNACAAQTVLAKVSQSGLAGSGQGLALLLQMTDGQRLEHFGRLLGDGVFRRLHEAMDRTWSSNFTAVG